MPRHVRALGLLLAVAMPSVAPAQSRTAIALTLGPSFIQFDGFGSSLGAAVAQVRLTRELTSHTGAEVTAFSLVPLGAVSVTPTCLPQAQCESRTTPNQLNGGFASAFVDVGESPLRVSAGYGYVSAVGGQGSGARSSGAWQVGLDWSRQRQSGLSFSAGVRALHLATPLYGARQLLLPGVGVSF